MTHSHKCGLISTPQGTAQLPWGCGRVWQHTGLTGNEFNSASAAHHMCPNCGKGPWYTQVAGIGETVT